MTARWVTDRSWGGPWTILGDMSLVRPELAAAAQKQRVANEVVAAELLVGLCVLSATEEVVQGVGP
eukprot:3250566-Lingulodinium_polyedra.AAC.1